MKTSKKIIIPFFSTVVGLSLAAGIGGAFAWYQYNSQATASFVGSSVADTGVLQIGWKTLEDTDHDESTPKVEVMHWGRDFSITGAQAKLTPVTFGGLLTDDSDPSNVKTKVLPQQAYAYPEAGAATGYEIGTVQKPGWVAAEAGKQYAQFEVYFRALAADATAPGDAANNISEGYKLVERNVFLSDYICKSVENNKVADEALRIHLDIEDNENRLLSKTAVNDLELYGGLDLDADGEKDKAVVTAWRDLESYGVDEHGDPLYAEGDEIVYGVQGQKQSTDALNVVKQARDDDGKMPTSGSAGFNKKILTTSTEKAIKMKVTIWLEGWEYLKTGVDSVSGEDVKAQEWNPKYSAETDVQVGLKFDSGIFRGEDL